MTPGAAGSAGGGRVSGGGAAGAAGESRSPGTDRDHRADRVYRGVFPRGGEFAALFRGQLSMMRELSTVNPAFGQSECRVSGPRPELSAGRAIQPAPARRSRHRKPRPPPQAEINSRHTMLNSLTINDHELRDSLGDRKRSTIMIPDPIYTDFTWSVVGLWSLCRVGARSTLHNTETSRSGHDQPGLLAGGATVGWRGCVVGGRHRCWLAGRELSRRCRRTSAG